jgi:Abortive infection C-terminus
VRLPIDTRSEGLMTGIVTIDPPLTEGIAFAAARLVDDRQAPRQPAHYDLERIIKECSLETADPNKGPGQPVGKAKRIRIVLLHALEHDPPAGQRLVRKLVTAVRSDGGFRENSDNYVGAEAITNLASELRGQGFELSGDGYLRPIVLDTLTGVEVTDALKGYARRAQQGALDAALVVGTGKDLLEAAAAHVLLEQGVPYDFGKLSFPDRLAAAFVSLRMTIPKAASSAPSPQERIEMALFEAGCAVNTLRNKQGTGHGRPFLPTVSSQEATIAIQVMGVVAADMLRRL